MIETITHLVDPEASRLPRLRDPRAVGSGLVGLAVTYFVVAALVVLPRAVPGLGRIFGHSWALSEWPVPPRAVAAVVGLLGLWWLWLVARTPADAPAAAAERSIRWMCWGQIGWSLFALLPVAAEWAGRSDRALTAPLEVAAVPWAVAALLGLRGLLRVVGLRSRAYRTAKGGRQSVGALVAAVLAGATGSVMNGIGAGLEIEWLKAIGQTIFGASSALLLLGLLYLIVNCWWIRASLRQPPPKLEALVKTTVVEEDPAATG